MVRPNRNDDGELADVRDVRQAGVRRGSPERGVLTVQAQHGTGRRTGRSCLL